METVIIAVNGFYVFFQQGNDTHTVLHIIDNIELKLDFANLSQFDIFPQIAQPYCHGVFLFECVLKAMGGGGGGLILALSIPG